MDVSYFQVVHSDTATSDELPDDPDGMAAVNEPASQLHLTQVRLRLASVPLAERHSDTRHAVVATSAQFQWQEHEVSLRVRCHPCRELWCALQSESRV